MYSFKLSSVSLLFQNIQCCVSVLFMIRSNWSTASINFITSSSLVISLGSRCPRQSEEKLYVVKQKCTTANVVIYSDVSLFYYQKFFC